MSANSITSTNLIKYYNMLFKLNLGLCFNGDRFANFFKCVLMNLLNCLR